MSAHLKWMLMFVHNTFNLFWRTVDNVELIYMRNGSLFKQYMLNWHLKFSWTSEVCFVSHIQQRIAWLPFGVCIAFLMNHSTELRIFIQLHKFKPGSSSSGAGRIKSFARGHLSERKEHCLFIFLPTAVFSHGPRNPNWQPANVSSLQPTSYTQCMLLRETLICLL